MGIVYMTDNGSDLPDSYIKDRDLVVMYLHCMIDGKEVDFSQGTDSVIDDFYFQMREGKHAGTAQVTSQAFCDVFEKIFKEGNDIFYMAFSSELSGTCQGAALAREEMLAKYPDRKIYMIDTMQASMGQGLMVHYALNMRDAGKSPEEILTWLTEHRQNFAAWFTVAELAYLRRGGRISGAAAALGTLLDIKPVLHVDNEGRLIPVDKVRGRARSLRSLVDHMKAAAIDPAANTVFISHANAPEDAKKLETLIREATGATDIMIGDVGPTIGAHSGPDTIALFFYGNTRD